MSTWFYRILVNECKDMLRKRNRTKTEDIENLEYLFVHKEEKQILRKQQIQEMLTHLEEETRMIIILHYFEDKTLYQISEILNTPLSTIKSKLYRSLKVLKEQLLMEEKI